MHGPLRSKGTRPAWVPVQVPVRVSVWEQVRERAWARLREPVPAEARRQQVREHASGRPQEADRGRRLRGLSAFENLLTGSRLQCEGKHTTTVRVVLDPDLAT